MISFYRIEKRRSLDLITPDKGTIDEDDINITISEEDSQYKDTIDEDDSNNTISAEDNPYKGTIYEDDSNNTISEEDSPNNELKKESDTNLTNTKKCNSENYSNDPEKIPINHASSTLVDFIITEMKGNILLGQKMERGKFRDNSKYRKGNILVRVITRFLNYFLINILNNILRLKNNSSRFKKLPKSIVTNVYSNGKKEFRNISIKEIFSKKELYKNEYDEKNYIHNLNLIEKNENNECFKDILNRKFSEFYQDYINSKQFNVDEVNRLTIENNENDYIDRYIYVARNFLNTKTKNIFDVSS